MEKSDDVMVLRGLVKAKPTAGEEFGIGVGVNDDGRPCVVLSMLGREFAVSPDEADDIAQNLHNFAVEVRNGGRMI